MRKRLARKIGYVSAISIIILVLTSFSTTETKGNGGGTGDSILEYDCAGSCHTSLGDGINSIASSNLNPMAGQTITVTVTVTETSLGSSKLIGVFLLKELNNEGSIPSEDGWNILSDPNGGTNNYVEKEGTSGVPIDFTWTLKVPSDPGTYNLYTRIHHGPGVLYEDNTEGLEFEVSDAPSGIPIIDHTPVTKAFIGEVIHIEATIKDASESYLYWKFSSDENFDKAIKMSKVSQDSNGHWTFNAEIPTQTEVGVIEYYINATNGDLFSATPTTRITVIEEPLSPNLMAWGIQILIVMEAVGIFAFIAVKMSANGGKLSNNKKRDGNG